MGWCQQEKGFSLSFSYLSQKERKQKKINLDFLLIALAKRAPHFPSFLTRISNEKLLALNVSVNIFKAITITCNLSFQVVTCQYLGKTDGILNRQKISLCEKHIFCVDFVLKSLCFCCLWFFSPRSSPLWGISACEMFA